MKRLFVISLLLTGITFISCKESSSQKKLINRSAKSENTKIQLDDSLIIYQSANLKIKKLSNHIYQHISYLKTDDFGKVECNGMLVVNENQGIVFDTPTNNNSSLELINFITNELKNSITAIIPTHFHEDCVGGIQEFKKQNIPIYAANLTVELLKENGQDLPGSTTIFENSITLNLGNKKVYAKYFGEGHTKDNVIGYFPESAAMFGGCLIKTFGASKGYLGDANTDKWSETVQQIKLNYPNTEIIIPGHGKAGGIELLDYTIKLFEVN
ncbi:subclass B1 metallo-beta-lactamase [Paucihalobacter sp.]|uniref:subclass B1 metallo-beta-lactamase n=1 Tax=Paucihalobacter sp. TaxID=2850405 RepID=UPI003D160895